MTTLSPSTGGVTHSADRAGGVVRLGGAHGLLIGLLVVACGALFYRWLFRQFGTGGWSYHHFEDWGHAYIVPLISGAYVWKHRAEMLRRPLEAFWPGLAVMLMGIVSYVYFITGYPNHMFQGFAIILSLAGLAMLLVGPRAFPVLVFPLGYLLFTVTISEMIMIRITWGLKLLASQGAWAMLNLMGIDTDINGNILEVHSRGRVIPLNVADACSGMRMVIAFIALAAAVAFLSCRHWWQRIAVLILAVPVALLMNVVRVAVLGIASLFNPELASGGAHTFIGTLLLVPAFFLFMGCVWLLQKAQPEGSTP